ncbi:hypothetical protein [Mycolicibacterium palauense]|uniref:hypothetical protein n=1 Tax=Mycolicibacterium palauense TaxID=2034511 RepID=UPI000BFEE477|nr:hypothetical protein [Mycolicibacterium palauense]
MPGIADIALGAAPIAGGALLGIAAGNLRGGPDIRATIKADMDLLDRLPEQQTQRRADLERVIGRRVDALVAGVDRNFALREAASNYRGNWRDIVLFIGSVLFTIVWWQVDHSKSNWEVMFVVLLALSLITLVNAVRGGADAFESMLRGRGTSGKAG